MCKDAINIAFEKHHTTNQQHTKQAYTYNTSKTEPLMCL